MAGVKKVKLSKRALVEKINARKRQNQSNKENNGVKVHKTSENVGSASGHTHGAQPSLGGASSSSTTTSARQHPLRDRTGVHQNNAGTRFLNIAI